MKNFLQHILTRFVFLIILTCSISFSFSQTDKLKKSLDYINEQFKKYNSYNMQFKIDPEGKNIISRSMFFEVIYPVNQISSIYFTERGEKDCIIFFKCRNNEECFNSTNLNDNSKDAKQEYSFNLESTPEIAERVVTEFLAIKNSILNPDISEEPAPLNSSSEIIAQLDYINKMLKKYNDFNIQFSIDLDNKIIQSRSDFFEITYHPSTIYSIDLITRGDNDYKINFTCKLDVTCLNSVDLRNNKVELINSYPVNFNGNAEEAQKMINAFNLILQNLNK